MSSDQSDIVVDVRGLSKSYQIYKRPHDRLKQFLSFGRRQYYREFWALQDVDLQVRRGETVGVIGRNGSGKSTLLQIICGTLQPTKGEVTIRGRVAALLELGAGFNPDFTGRENVRLYGSVLGLSEAEITARLPEILAFAEIGDFIDMPVKTYSSGMYVRLAFSVAINVDPDILVVDEALAVGDGRFQHRCMTRIKQMQERGVSILYVSHDTEGVKRLCNEVLVLQDGRVVNRGQPLHMSNWYLALMTVGYDLEKLAEMNAEQEAPPSAEPPPGATTTDHQLGVDITLPEFRYFRHGDGTARIVNIVLADEAGHALSAVALGEVLTVHFDVEFHADLHDYIIGFYITDRLGTNVIGLNSYQERAALPQVQEGARMRFTWRFPIDLRPGFYSLSPSIAYNQFSQQWLDYIDNALVLRVVDRDLRRSVFGIYLPAWRTLEAQPIEVSALPAG
jgi:lipopolysaccharide transport system ATP-binding protein